MDQNSALQANRFRVVKQPSDAEKRVPNEPKFQERTEFQGYGKRFLDENIRFFNYTF